MIVSAPFNAETSKDYATKLTHPFRIPLFRFVSPYKLECRCMNHNLKL